MVVAGARSTYTREPGTARRATRLCAEASSLCREALVACCWQLQVLEVTLQRTSGPPWPACHFRKLAVGSI